MTSFWRAPAVVAFVERLPELTKAGRNRTKGHKHFLAPCDVCWEATWVAESELKVIWACPTCKRSSTRMASPKTPVCVGRTIARQKFAHDPIEMSTSDPLGGRGCRMTPKCPGRHRREGLVPAIAAGVPRCAVCRDRDATATAVHRKTGDRWPTCGRCKAQAERYRVPVEFSDLRAEEAA